MKTYATIILAALAALAALGCDRTQVMSVRPELQDTEDTAYLEEEDTASDSASEESMYPWPNDFALVPVCAVNMIGLRLENAGVEFGKDLSVGKWDVLVHIQGQVVPVTYKENLIRLVGNNACASTFSVQFIEILDDGKLSGNSVWYYSSPKGS